MDALKTVPEQDMDDGSSDKTVDHPAMRLLPLGQDREGHVYWKLSSNTIFTGDFFICSAWDVHQTAGSGYRASRNFQGCSKIVRIILFILPP